MTDVMMMGVVCTVRLLHHQSKKQETDDDEKSGPATGGCGSVRGALSAFEPTAGCNLCSVCGAGVACDRNGEQQQNDSQLIEPTPPKKKNYLNTSAPWFNFN